MRRSLLLLLPALLAMASCGTTSRYASSQWYPDGIYYRPEPVVQLYSEEDFKEMAARNLASKSSARDTVSVPDYRNDGYYGYYDRYYDRYYGGWYSPFYCHGPYRYSPYFGCWGPSWYGGWYSSWYDPWYDPYWGPSYYWGWPRYYGYGHGHIHIGNTKPDTHVTGTNHRRSGSLSSRSFGNNQEPQGAVHHNRAGRSSSYSNSGSNSYDSGSSGYSGSSSRSSGHSGGGYSGGGYSGGSSHSGGSGGGRR